MREKEIIVRESIVKLSHRKHGQQYAVRIWWDTGEKETHRLPECFPVAKKYEDESAELKSKAELIKLNIIRQLGNAGPRPPAGCKYKTCKSAMEAYVEWYQEDKKNKKIKFYGRKFIEHFGDMSIGEVKPSAAREWIEALIDDTQKDYSFNTVRLCVMTASGMITWLVEQEMWDRMNPFSGLLKRYKRRFSAVEPPKSYFEPDEYNKLWKALQKKEYAKAQIFFEFAYCTGLRPYEIVGEKAKERPGIIINKNRYFPNDLVLEYLVTKTQDVHFYRKIAIPQRLATFIANRNILGALPFTESELRRQIEQVRKEVGIQFTQKTFRKDFTHRMELAGANHDTINLHQGRCQHGVLNEHYLTDTGRAVRLCRPYINEMFEEKVATITRVK